MGFSRVMPPGTTLARTVHSYTQPSDSVAAQHASAERKQKLHALHASGYNTAIDT